MDPRRKPTAPGADKSGASSVLATRLLFYLNTAIWLVLAAVSLVRLARGTAAAQPVVLLIIAALMVGNAGAMLLAGWGLGRARIFFPLALLLLGINILLSFTDQVGFLDLSTLLIDLALLVLVILNRSTFWTSSSHERL